MKDNIYIILDSNKKPLHKFKDGKAKTWDEVKDFNNIGMIVPEPFIVLDFDTVSDYQIMLKIIEDLDLHCNVMKTSRGYHIWFKSAEPWKNFVKSRLALGIYCDCRSYGKNGYVKIKDNGVLRKWIRRYDDNDISYVPKYLYPVNRTGNNFSFKGMKSGDGRNQELFNYIVFLQSKGFKRDEVKYTLELINKYVFAESLAPSEMATIIRDEAFKTDEEVEQEQKKAASKKFRHDLLAAELAKEKHIICVNNILYIYLEGYYQPAQIEIEKEMIRRVPDITSRQRDEVIKYLKILTYKDRDDIKVNPYIINLMNCRLNITNGNRLDYTPEAIEFERLPVNYDSSVYCSAVDKLLNKVFCADRECMDLFEEILGDCLLHKNIYQKAFLFYGSGSNGKSTILKLIRKLIGPDNVSTVSLDQLSTNFMAAELENKLVNIGDDINYKPIKDSGTLKKLFSGEPLTVQRKFAPPFVLESYTTHLFSCNEIPRNSDKSDGMYRRWCFVPFNAKFTKDDPDYDPLVFEKVSTPEALSYLLNLAIKGLRRLRRRGYYKEPAVVQEAMRLYAIENNSVLSWIEDEEITREHTLETPRDGLYARYKNWCQLSGVREAVGVKTFYKEICKKYGLSAKSRLRKADGKRYFVAALDF